MGLGRLALPKSIETDFICAVFFSPETYYFTSIPFFISFINSIFVIFYMSYTKYRISKVPGQNLKFRSSQIQTISNNISGRNQNTNNQRRHQGRRIAWQASSNVPGTLSCYPPAISGFFEVLNKYLKVNIFNLLIMAINLPQFVFDCYVKYWDLKCEEWKVFLEYIYIFQMIFVFLYPYFVKVKLRKFP